MAYFHQTTPTITTTSSLLTNVLTTSLAVFDDIPSTTIKSIAVKTTHKSSGWDDDDSNDFFKPTPSPHAEASSFLIPHVVMTILAFGVLFPLGIAAARKSRVAHYGFQVFGVLIGIIGIIFGKLGWSGSDWRTGKVQIVISGKYDLTTKLHQSLGWLVFLLLLLQVAMGPAKATFLAWKQQGHDSGIPNFSLKYKLVNATHYYLAWTLMILAYVLTVTGINSLAGTCSWDGVSGCLSKLIVGSFFIFYSANGLLRLLHPSKTNQMSVSEEFIASVIMVAFGIAAVILSLMSGDPPFSHAILFFSAGILGLTVEASKVFKGRNPVPGVMIFTLGMATVFSSSVDPFAATENDYAALILLYLGYMMAASGIFKLVEITVRSPPEITSEDDETGGVVTVLSNKPRYESVPSFLSLFFLFMTGVLFIGSSSGAPPRWAWLARIDSVGYAEIYLGIGMVSLSWIVLLGSISQRWKKQTTEVLMEREEEDDVEQAEYHAMDQSLNIPSRPSFQGLRSRSPSPAGDRMELKVM